MFNKDKTTYSYVIFTDLHVCEMDSDKNLERVKSSRV